MSAIEQQDSHRPPSDGGMAKEEFIRVGTTLYKIVEQPRLNGGYVKKHGRMVTNNPRNKNVQWLGAVQTEKLPKSKCRITLFGRKNQSVCRSVVLT